MSFVERFIIQYPYYGGSTIGGSSVHMCAHVHTINACMCVCMSMRMYAQLDTV